MSNSWSLRFEFITGSDGGRVLSSMAQIEGYLHQKSVASVGVEPFDCTIPLKVYGALKVSKQQKKVFEFELWFLLANQAALYVFIENVYYKEDKS